MYDERELRMSRKNRDRRDGDMHQIEESYKEKVEKFERKMRYLIWGE